MTYDLPTPHVTLTRDEARTLAALLRPAAPVELAARLGLRKHQLEKCLSRLRDLGWIRTTADGTRLVAA